MTNRFYMPLSHQLRALLPYEQGWPKLRQHKDQSIYETQRDWETHSTDLGWYGIRKTLRRGLIERPFANFHQVCSEMVLTAMKGATGINRNSLSDDYKEYKRLYRFLSKFVRDEYETSTKEFLQLRKLKEQQEALEPKTIPSRFKKIRPTRKANNDDAAALKELTREYNQKLDQLDDAWWLLEKHCVIFNMVWDADALFSCKGINQGKLFTNGFQGQALYKAGQRDVVGPDEMEGQIQGGVAARHYLGGSEIWLLHQDGDWLNQDVPSSHQLWSRQCEISRGGSGNFEKLWDKLRDEAQRLRPPTAWSCQSMRPWD